MRHLIIRHVPLIQTTSRRTKCGSGRQAQPDIIHFSSLLRTAAGSGRPSYCQMLKSVSTSGQHGIIHGGTLRVLTRGGDIIEIREVTWKAMLSQLLPPRNRTIQEVFTETGEEVIGDEPANV